MEQRPRIAVILLNYGDYAQRYLEPCYESLRRQTYPAERFQVFVVSNGVTAHSRSLIARVAPEARVFENAENIGWSGGNNRAIRVALEEGFDLFVMLNLDTVVEPDWLNELVESAVDQPETQIFQSKIMLDGTNRINSLGNRVQYLGYGYCLGYGQEDGHVPRKLAMDFASGASMLVKREVFEKVGLFREEYFMYYDDLEFCWRARIAGFRVGLVEASVCFHKYDFTSRLGMLYYLQRNRLLTLLTLERLGTIVVTAPCLIVSEVIVSLYFIARGWGRTTWKLLRYFLRWKTWRSIAARRQEIRALRTTKDTEIVGRFAADVMFAEVDSPAMRYLCNPLLRIYWAVAKRFIIW